MPDSTTDVSELARQVVDELDPGSRIGDKIILSRRQLVAIAGAGLSAGALATFGVSEAEAQEAAGAIGTEDEPVEAFLSNYGSESTTDGYEITIAGDTYEFVEE